MEIRLVDAPDKVPPGTPEWQIPEEHQRTYKLTELDGKVHTVRVRRDVDTSYNTYVIENLVGGKWHRLLTGNCSERIVPFEAAAVRASKVLG